MTFITPRKVFAHLERLAGWQRGDTPAPVTVEFDLSNRCYLGCESCHFRHTHVRGPWASKPRVLPMAWEGVGDLADPELVRRALDEMAAAGVRGIVWSGGGEPTTHPDLVGLMAHAAGVGLEQGIYTAGGLLTPDTAAHIASLASWVVVSLDTVDAETYTAEKGVKGDYFDRACAGVRMLAAERHTTIGVSFLLHARNWTHAPQMVALARSLGATYTTFRPTIETSADAPAVITGNRDWITDAFGPGDDLSGRTLPLRALAAEPDVELDIARFYEYRDWSGRSYDTCHGIKLNATITPDGRVWVCPQRRGLPGACVGDLRVESFSDLWQRHPGQWSDFSDCRAMCRLHLVNEQLANVFTPQRHEAFV